MFKPTKMCPSSSRVYINLRFTDHNYAKGFNCLWDSRINKWYLNKNDYTNSEINQSVLLHGELSPHMIIDGSVCYI